MTKQIPNYLKLHVEEAPAPESPRLEDFPSLEHVCRSLVELSGWTLRYRPGFIGSAADLWSMEIPGGTGLGGGSLVLAPSEDSGGSAALQVSLPEITPLATAVGGLLSELQKTRHALWQREAELATGIPVSTRTDEEEHLSERLEAILRGGAEAVGCQAAALYMLDEATSQLKLRSCFGIPKQRLLEPPRPLRGAVADLEALIGHAVVLEDTSLLPHWKTPLDFAAAVCLPVSSPSSPLGTLWIFSNQVRDFSSEQTQLLEIVAGRLAAELEREVLLHEGTQSRALDRQMRHAAQWQDNRLPRIAPLLDDWQLAGWTAQAAAVGGDFYDWCVLPDSNLAMAVGDAQGAMFEAGLTAAAVHTAVKSHACYRHDAREMINRVNETLWTSSTGDQFASLWYALLNPETGAAQFCSAGHISAVLVRGNGHEVLSGQTAPLGTEPENDYKPLEFQIEAGDALVVFTEGLREARPQRLDEQAVAEAVRSHADQPAEMLVEVVRGLVHSHPSGQPTADRTVLVARRVS